MIRALTILQPWAHFIAHGPKRIENRSWAPPASLVRHHLAIHAGKRFTKDLLDGAVEFAADLPKEQVSAIANWKICDLPLGAVVAIARLVGHVTESDDPWFCGPIGWQLSDVVAIEPVPFKGAQGLWELPPTVLAEVRARYAGRARLK